MPEFFLYARGSKIILLLNFFEILPYIKRIFGFQRILLHHNFNKEKINEKISIISGFSGRFSFRAV